MYVATPTEACRMSSLSAFLTNYNKARKRHGLSEADGFGSRFWSLKCFNQERQKKPGSIIGDGVFYYGLELNDWAMITDRHL
mmetsp:Transcript_30010/g.45513  ORF Transcript_30010/g.45513 Transcript_30010/m.45513 type:complete len:82 (+) Transcript_30010:487-732(+)